jgi:hypothetical protein
MTPELLEAIRGARFVLHTVLLGEDQPGPPTQEAWDMRNLNDSMGRELAAEVLHDLQTALEAYYSPEKPPPICSGCSPIRGFEKAA